MRVALFNDTGRFPHVGCRAVSSGLDRMLDRAGLTVAYRSFHGECGDLVHRVEKRRIKASRKIAKALELVDAVIVNGEGTIHHRGGRDLIAVLKLARCLGKQVYLVNAVLQDLHRDDCEVLRDLSGCTVREPVSSSYLSKLCIPHEVVFDAIIEAEFVPEPSMELAGRVIVTDWHGSRSGDVGRGSQRLLEQLGEDAVFYPLQDPQRAELWQHAVADFRGASVVVTGRFHGVCLAVLAGVPFVALGSNTWKVEGLAAWFGRDVADPLSDLRVACRQAQAQPASDLRSFVEAQRPLWTFERIGEAVAA